MSETAQILRIEKISPNDGAGLRTVVFFKGCPMRCQWCSTPESQNKALELCCNTTRCTLCGQCIPSCPQKALSRGESPSRILVDKARCDSCFECVAVCPSRGLGVYGREMTVAEVMKHIARDEIFYHHSGGGVTLSGGDVLCQPEFARNLLMACKDSGLHTMAELNMFGDYKNIALILPLLDACYIDIKVMDAERHRKWTGVDNSQILHNTRQAAEALPRGALHIRLPLIWNINDDQPNIADTANFCQSLAACGELEFLPYHRLGQAAHEYTWRDYPLKELRPMTLAEARAKIDFLKDMSFSFPIKVAGETVFTAHRR